jgi:hypothetical protein
MFPATSRMRASPILSCFLACAVASPSLSLSLSIQSSTGGGGRGSDQGTIIGDVINHGTSACCCSLRPTNQMDDIVYNSHVNAFQTMAPIGFGWRRHACCCIGWLNTAVQTTSPSWWCWKTSQMIGTPCVRVESVCNQFPLACRQKEVLDVGAGFPLPPHAGARCVVVVVPACTNPQQH